MTKIAINRQQDRWLLACLLGLLLDLGGCTSARLQAQVEQYIDTAPKDKLEPGLIDQLAIKPSVSFAAEEESISPVVGLPKNSDPNPLPMRVDSSGVLPLNLSLVPTTIANVESAPSSANPNAALSEKVGSTKIIQPLSAPTIQVTRWANLPSDESLQKTLERWAQIADWRVNWTNAPLIHNSGPFEVIDTDFLGAASQVLRKTDAAARLAGFTVVYTAGDRVLSVSQGNP